MVIEFIRKYFKAARGIFPFLLVLILTLASFVYSQSAPHLTGQIKTNPTTGIFSGDICLSKLIPQQTYSFLLNRGLNIREVRDLASNKPLKYEGFYDSKSVGDAIRYDVKSGIGTAGFCINYVGAYPVYRIDAGERSEFDWKGQIAFDGRTVRAAEQTRFYPVVLDSKDAPLDSVSYQLNVECTDCKSLYVNGSKPKAGPKGTFSSDSPRPLLLYAGDFPFTSAGNIHFVGSDISTSDAEEIRTGIKTAADAHTAYLKIPYKDEPVYMTFASVSRYRKIDRTTWQFVSWPTIAMDGRITFSSLLRENEKRRAFIPDINTAHEMAHYYFGTLYAPRGPLQWFLLESTAEFLAMKSTRAISGENAYTAVVRNHYKEAIALREIVPLDRVQQAEQISQNYRYRLGPLLLLALEQYTNEDIVQRTLAGLITNPPTGEVSYVDFRARLKEGGASDEMLNTFEVECLRGTLVTCLSKLPQIKNVN